MCIENRVESVPIYGLGSPTPPPTIASIMFLTLHFAFEKKLKKGFTFIMFCGGRFVAYLYWVYNNSISSKIMV